MKTEMAIVKKSNRTETFAMILRGVAICLVLLAVSVLPAWAQGIMFDSSGHGTTGSSNSSATISWTHTIVGTGTRSNGLLIVSVGENSSTQGTMTCTEGGNSMTEIAAAPILGSIYGYFLQGDGHVERRWHRDQLHRDWFW